MNKSKSMEFEKVSAELQEDSKLLNIIFDHTPIMFAYMDSQFNFIKVNKAYAKADNKNVDYFIGKNHFNLYPNLENEKIFRSVVESGIPYEVKAKPFEYSEYPERGITYWDWSLVPFKDKFNNVQGVLLSVQNVTERWEAEIKLKQSEEKLRNINIDLEKEIQKRTIDLITEKKLTDEAINAQIDTFFVFDPHKGKAIRWNTEFKEVTGYSDEEICNLKAPESYYNEADLAKASKATEIIVQQGYAIIEMDLHCKNGSIIPFEYKGTGIFDDEGSLKYIVSIGRDITDRKKAEQIIRESEEKFRTIAEQTMVGIVIVQENKLKYVNDGLAKLYGYSIEEMLKWNPGDFLKTVAPDSVEMVMEQAEKKQKGDPTQINHYQIHVIKKSGEMFWVDNYSKTIQYQGKPADLVIQVDITEKIQSELYLRESEEKFRSIAESSLVSILIVQDDVIKYINNAVAKISGFSVSEMLNWKPNEFLKVIHEDYRDFINDHVKRQQNGDSDQMIHYQFKVITKTGEEKWIDEHSTTIQYQGRPASLLIFVDITERMKIEQNLKESEEKFRNIAEQSLVGIAIAQDDLVKYANQKFAQMWGYSINEMLNWKPGEFLKIAPPESRDFIREQVTKKQTGDPSQIVHYRTKGLKKSGEIFWVETYSRTIDYNGRFADLIVVIDVTERYKVEKELENLSQMKSDLLIRTSHELKTPLVSIKGYTQILLKLYQDKMDIEALSMIEKMKDGCIRLETLINSMLKTIELESGILKLDKKKENLSLLILDCIDELKILSFIRNHEIKSEIPNSILVPLDKEEIRHVVLNLLTNAFNYTPPYGKIQLSAEVSTYNVIISIKDSGVGFTNKEKVKIFTQFGKVERYGRGLDVISEGSGLGLYISKKIIELHGGKIWVESEGRNKGSIFHFSLPLI